MSSPLQYLTEPEFAILPQYPICSTVYNYHVAMVTLSYCYGYLIMLLWLPYHVAMVTLSNITALASMKGCVVDCSEVSNMLDHEGILLLSCI